MIKIQLILVFESDSAAAQHISSLDIPMHHMHRLMRHAMRNKEIYGKPCLFMMEMIIHITPALG